MVSSAGHQKSDLPRVAPVQDRWAPAGSAIRSPSAEEDVLRVDRPENDLRSVVELLDEAIEGHRQLRTQILPKLHSQYDHLFDKLQNSHSRLRTVAQRTASNVPIAVPCGSHPRTSDSAADNHCASSTTAMEASTSYEDSVQAQIAQFVNWYHLWQASLIKDMQSHLEEISQKLNRFMVKEATRRNVEWAAFQPNSPLQPVFCPSTSAPHPDQHHLPTQELEPNSHPAGECVNSMEESYSHLADASSDRFSPTTTGGAVVELEILRTPVSSISLIPIEQLIDKTSVASSSKSSPIVVMLQPDQKAQSPTSANAEEVRSLTAEDVKELWKTIETHPVVVHPPDSLRAPMRSLVLLSLVVGDQSLFYEHVLFCAQQLRNPAQVNKLAIVVSASADAVAPSAVGWLAYKSTSQSTSQDLLHLLPQEQQFFNQVSQLSAIMLVIWGSAYACLLLRLHDHGVGYVCRQLRQLNQQLAEAYELEERLLPRIPVDSKTFLDKLRKYTKYPVDKVCRNTLYKGLIECYEYTAPAQRTKKFLNFLLLTSLRYRRMSLIALVDECRRLYRISTDELFHKTWTSETSASWQRYKLFTSTLIKSNCKKYKYLVVFHPQEYKDLHFDSNLSLCSLLCVLIDMHKVKSGCGSSTVLYHRLVRRIRMKYDSPRIDATWKRECMQIVKKFTN